MARSDQQNRRKNFCPECGKPLEWYDEFEEWRCDDCGLFINVDNNLIQYDDDDYES